MLKFWMIIAAGWVTGTYAATKTLDVEWNLIKASDSRQIGGSRSVEIDLNDQSITLSHPMMMRTMFLVQSGEVIQTALNKFWKSCRQKALAKSAELLCLEKFGIADSLAEDVDSLLARYPGYDFQEDREISEFISLAKKLSKNMANYHGEDQNIALRTALMARGMNVTTGGIQNFGHFKANIMNGKVPKADDFILDGVLKDFDLSIGEVSCSIYLCVDPNWGYDPQTGRLYVQFTMSSSVSEAMFKRKPVNLSLVIDVSGSMDASDGTGKSRLEWAKEAVRMTLAQLDERDIFSLVIFNGTSQVIISPQQYLDSIQALRLIDQLRAGGTTNFAAGLYDGVGLVEDYSESNYENRVIIISDAGLNTGETSTEEISRVVDRASQKMSFLTVIGMGHDFKSDLVEAISDTKGGNYIFVNSGAEMLDYFKSFKYLVSPIAYDLNIKVAFHEVEARLSDLIGVPFEEDQSLSDTLININTLFFSPQKGGAVVASYDLGIQNAFKDGN